MKGFIIAAICTAAALLTAACSMRGTVTDGDGMENSYKQISQEEAKDMMKKEDGHVIVDVRRGDEYAEAHIPGAICIPNESIGTDMPAELPDKEQIILVYCRSGRRSKEAAQKLFDMGYKNVYEFGGIIDWTGETVSGDIESKTDALTSITESGASEAESTSGTAHLSFDSFDGGGPEYDVFIDDESIVTYRRERVYYESNHEEMNGAGFDVIFTFTGLKQGETGITVTSTMEDNKYYWVKVDNDLKVSIEESEIEEMDPSPILCVSINGKTFPTSIERNSSAEAFIAEISSGPLTLTMSDNGGFEKNAELGFELPTNDFETTTAPGDIIQYNGNTLAISCINQNICIDQHGLSRSQLKLNDDENTQILTRLGHINATNEELLEAFGEGDATVEFWVEWTE